MDRQFSRDHRWTYWFWCLVLIYSILYSRYMISVSIIMLFFLSLVHIKSWRNFDIERFKEFKNGFISAFRSPLVLSCFSIFLVTFLSGLVSDDTGRWFHFVILKLPYIILPIALFLGPRFTQGEFVNLLLCLVGICVVSGMEVLWSYGMNFDSTTKSIGEGKAILTPIVHPKYGSYIAFGAVMALVLFLQDSFVFKKWKRWFLGFSTVFLIVFLHIVAIRSGLVGLYLTILILGSYFLYKKRDFIKMILLWIFLISAPFIAYKCISSFQKKVDYTVYDFKMRNQGNGDNYSDSERIRSWNVGLDLIKERPLLGSGYGDLVRDVEAHYVDIYGPSEMIRQPHNQFIFVAVGAGFLGLILFNIGYFLPLFYIQHQRGYLLLVFFVILTSLCLVEKPLERSNFIAYHIFMVMILSMNSYLLDTWHKQIQ